MKFLFLLMNDDVFSLSGIRRTLCFLSSITTPVSSFRTVLVNSLSSFARCCVDSSFNLDIVPLLSSDNLFDSLRYFQVSSGQVHSNMQSVKPQCSGSLFLTRRLAQMQ